MKVKVVFLVFLLVWVALGTVVAQKPVSVFPGRSEEISGGLQGILIDDQPALKLVTSKGGSVFIRFGIRDGEEVLAFPVIHLHQLLYAGAPGEAGSIYVSKTRISYVPVAKESDHGFDVISSEMKKIEFSKGSKFGRNIGSNLLLKTTQKDYRFWVSQGIKHEELLPLADYFKNATLDFDAAVQRFKQLTSNIQRTGGPVFTALGKELIPTKDLSQITTKYDRFKDVTTVGLQSIVSKPDDPRFEMLGPIISLLASYQFNGQTQKAPPEFVLFSLQIYVIEGSQTRYRDSFNLIEEFIVLTDGERIVNRMDRTELRDSIGGKYEIVSCHIPISVFTKIMQAKQVEMRIGAYEVQIRQYHLQAFRDLVARTQQ